MINLPGLTKMTDKEDDELIVEQWKEYIEEYEYESNNNPNWNDKVEIPFQELKAILRHVQRLEDHVEEHHKKEMKERVLGKKPAHASPYDSLVIKRKK